MMEDEWSVLKNTEKHFHKEDIQIKMIEKKY